MTSEVGHPTQCRSRRSDVRCQLDEGHYPTTAHAGVIDGEATIWEAVQADG